MSSTEAVATEEHPNVEPREALEFLSTVRVQLKCDFGLIANAEEEQLNDNIEHNINVIRALLAVNLVILSRCMEHAVGTGKKTTLARFGFETIKTRQVVDTKLELVTQAERVVRTFDTWPLSMPPSGFEKIIVVKYMPLTEYVDFNDLFRKTLLLNDDALGELLPKLKGHLESIQVCLGELDEWVMQPMKNVSFINGIFEKEHKIPSDIDPTQTSLECCFCQSSLLRFAPGRAGTVANGECRISRRVNITVCKC
jgi:hypothetical protein